MGIVSRCFFTALALAAMVPPSFAKPPMTKRSAVSTTLPLSDLGNLVTDITALAQRVAALTSSDSADKIVDVESRVGAARSRIDDYGALLAADGATLSNKAALIAMLQASAPQLAERMMALETAQLPIPAPSVPQPVPAPDTAPRASNTVRITNASGHAQRNYPLQFGRPFVCGEIRRYPQVVINGTPVLTQADVKNRCKDGSVKFAIIAAMIPELPTNGSLTLMFRDQATGNNQLLTTEQMMDASYNFDARIQLAKPASITGSADPILANWKAVTSGSLAISVDGTIYQLTGLNFSSLASIDYLSNVLNAAAKATKAPFSLYYMNGQGFVFGGKTIALRTPIAGTDIAPLLLKSNVATTPSSGVSAFASVRAMLKNGACKPWTQGPVAQTMLCADDSIDRVYDLGFDSYRSFRPRFYVTFWPATHQVAVRYVGEISNTQALAAFYYDLALTLGDAKPRTVYTQANIPHSIATRWTQLFWLNGIPEQKINVDYNIRYLAATYLIPNYDPAVVVPESAINYARWSTADRSIGGAGWWQKAMPTAGGRQDIGPMPAWTIKWLYTGDWRAREIALTQADLAGSWGAQLREGDPARRADKAGTVPGLGRTITRYSRPTSWGLDARDAATAGDKLVILSRPTGAKDSFAWSGWSIDGAHQPDPSFPQYLMTGDYFYLEELQLWAGAASVTCNPIGAAPWNCGPGARIYDQVRGQAWQLRNRVNAAVATPDDDPMRAVFVEMIDDAVAAWEGKFDIRGTRFEDNPMWNFTHRFVSTVNDGWGGLGLPPLRWWEKGAYPATDTRLYNPDVALSANAHWMLNYVIFELGRAAELGFPTQALLKWTAPNLIGQATDPSYNPYLIGQYVVPDMKKGPPPGHLTSWAEVMTAWAPEKRTTTDILYWPMPVNYFTEARAAAALIARLSGGAATWRSFEAMIATKTAATKQPINWGADPTWAIIPRAP